MERNTSLNLLYYPFRIRLLRGHELAINEGIPVRFFETFRTRRRQHYLYSKGRTSPGPIRTNAKAGYSYHNYGLATDLVMYADGKWDWSRLDHYKALVPIMESVGLEGLHMIGDWPHWQLADLPPINDIRDIYEQHGLEGVWLRLESKFG